MIKKTKVNNTFDARTFEESANTYDWKGLSTDTKPTSGVDVNDLFMELDTGDFYYFTGETWAKVGG